jgi:hypothetical protein
VVFIPRDFQQLVNYKFALDGTDSSNYVLTGRENKPIVSSTKWENNRLVITSTYAYYDTKNGEWTSSKVTQTLWLEPPTKTPWEPTLIVETTREGLFNGLTTTNRTVYTKGYR